jgi:peptide/nickel transport system substrate-binding protein
VNQIVAILSYEGLTRTRPDGGLVSQLAESWETSGGGLAITLRLRRGVTFHDGSELASGDVKASLDRSRLDPAQLSRYPMLSDIQATEARGPYTLVLQLRRPSGLLLHDLVVPIQKDREGQLVGTGPFAFPSFEDGVVSMQANRHYYRGEPAIATVQIRTYESVRAAWAAMMRGEVDCLYEVPIDAREFVEAESSVEVLSYLREYSYVIAFNLRRNLFRNPEVRVALNLAVDRDQIIDEALRGHGRPASGTWPLHWAYEGFDQPYHYDPRLADQLLTAQGLPMPEISATDQPAQLPSRLRFVCMVAPGSVTAERIALITQRQLYDIGVDMVLETVSLEAFYKRMASGDYDAVLFDLIGGPSLVRPYIFWRSPQPSAPRDWDFGYQAADEALDALRAAASDAEIREAALEFQERLRTAPPGIFLAWAETAQAVTQGFELPARPEGEILETLWQWRLAGSQTD